MADHDSPGDLHHLRRGAHEFLRRYAAHAWVYHHGGERWEITLPPDTAALPEHKRFKAHARQEARRLAVAHLYDLDPEITARAVHLGAAIRHEWHDEAVAMAGHPAVAATLDIAPPAATGFLRWRDPGGIGYSPRGAPVIACHWGPACGGRWLAWWADSHALATGYAADAEEAGQHLISTGFLPVFGPLWYDQQLLLRPGGGTATEHRDVPVPGPAAADAGRPAADPGSPVLALLYTTLATWYLLPRPDAVQLSQQAAPAAGQAADRAAGLHPRPVTVAAARHP